MFRNTYRKTAPKDRGEKFTTMDFRLSVLARVVEVLYLFALWFFLADPAGKAVTAAIPGIPGEVAVVFVLLFGFFLVSAPVAMMRSGLEAGFGMDPRPFGKRFLSFSGKALFFAPFLALGTAAAILSLQTLGALSWSLLYLALVWMGLLLATLFFENRIPSAAFLRAPRGDEFPVDFDRFVSLFSPLQNKSVPVKDVLLSSDFHKGLAAPYVSGSKLIIPERSLASFPPNALLARLVMAMLGHIFSSSGSLITLRFVCLALAVPNTLILLNSLGIFSGYPLIKNSPEFIPLVWMGVLSAVWFSVLSTRFVRRFLQGKLAATAAAFTKDPGGLLKSIDVMAEYNMDPTEEHAVRDFFRNRPSTRYQLRAIGDTLRDIIAGEAGKKAARDKTSDPFLDPRWRTGAPDGDAGGGAGGAGDGDGGKTLN
ncbi:MAG: hypothetical protein LBF41_02530 [Deltaproteobacteria bacterium]|jgi:hypothetical protein|nr:hypothetical protein [Deltaproteobacteria bacterium]